MPNPPCASIARAINLRKHFKNSGKQFARDADARIADFDYEGAFIDFGCDSDFAAWLRIFRCVVEQIHQHLSDAS